MVNHHNYLIHINHIIQCDPLYYHIFFSSIRTRRAICGPLTAEVAQQFKLDGKLRLESGKSKSMLR